MKLKSEINVEKNYTKISNEFFEGLTLDEIGLMSYLQHLSTRKFAVSSLADIAAKFSVSKRTLIRIIGSLEKKGFLKKSGERYDIMYCLKIGSDSCKNQPKDSDKIAPKDSDKIAPIVKTIVKEKEVKEKENSCFGYKYPTNKLTNEQIDSILRDLNLDDKIMEHPKDNEYYKIGGNLLGAGAISRMLSYIVLNPKYKEKNIANLLNNPSNFSELARSM